MPRQTEDISTARGALWQCDICDQDERRPVIATGLGSMDDSARVAGWRIGPGGTPVICPECAGTDPGYWDERILDGAAQWSGFTGNES